MDENVLKNISIHYQMSGSKIVYQINNEIEEIKTIHWEIHGLPRAVKKVKCGAKKMNFNTENGILRFEQSVSMDKNCARIVLKR